MWRQLHPRARGAVLLDLRSCNELSLKRLSVPFVGAMWTSSLFLHTR